jgi:hypothetical protein
VVTRKKNVAAASRWNGGEWWSSARGRGPPPSGHSSQRTQQPPQFDAANYEWKVSVEGRAHKSRQVVEHKRAVLERAEIRHKSLVLELAAVTAKVAHSEADIGARTKAVKEAETAAKDAEDAEQAEWDHDMAADGDTVPDNTMDINDMMAKRASMERALHAMNSAMAAKQASAERALQTAKDGVLALKVADGIPVPTACAALTTAERTDDSAAEGWATQRPQPMADASNKRAGPYSP